MDLGIKGKRAIITGGASGIGKAIARELVKEGALVAITSRKRDRLNAAFAELGGVEAGHTTVCFDIAEEGAPEKMAQELIANWGSPDIVVNNVGDTLGITDPYCQIEDWRRVFRLNLEVHIEVNNAFIPGMRERKWGRIVNITAGAALENSGPVPYCTMKAAYTAYTRSMARVLALENVNIVMSAVLPGVVITEHGHWQDVIKTQPKHAEKYLENRTVLKRFGTTDEISPIVALLCSEKASFCVGSIVPVEGGQARHYFATSGLQSLPVL